MSLMDKFWGIAKTRNKTIVLPEGEDERTIDAANAIAENGLCNVILLGDEAEIKKAFDAKGYEVRCKIIEPSKSEYLEDFTNTYYESRKAKGMSLEEAAESMKDVLYFGCMLVQKGIADGAVTGACHTTGDVLRAAIRVIGTMKGMKTVSSSFIMVTPKPEFGVNGAVLFADCAVNPNPDAKTLAEIAVSSAASCKSFLEVEPKVAMLSFSTKGSASHPDADKVIEALAIAKELDPNLAIDGELQADAALLELSVLRKLRAVKLPVKQMFLFSLHSMQVT